MSTIVTIASGDQISASRSDINANFAALNTDKIETSVIDTDTALAADSDDKIPSQKAVKAYIDALGGITALVPTGAILAYGAATAPSEFLLCDGSAVSRATYSTLFAILSTSYGVGDGSTTFNLPNLKGRFPLGYTASATTKVFTFASRSSDTITVTGADNHAHNEIQTGQAVLYDTTSGVITGLSDNTTYYLIRVTSTSFKLATSVANANAGTAITLSGDGSGTQTFTITYTARPLGQTGGEEMHALTDTELPSHSHSLVEDNGAGAISTLAPSNASTASATITGVTGSDTPHNIMPLFQVVQYIIKT